MFALNRMGSWDQLLGAWLSTGNPQYAAAFDDRAADWTEHNLPAPNRREGSNTTIGRIQCAGPCKHCVGICEGGSVD